MSNVNIDILEIQKMNQEIKQSLSQENHWEQQQQAWIDLAESRDKHYKFQYYYWSVLGIVACVGLYLNFIGK